MGDNGNDCVVIYQTRFGAAANKTSPYNVLLNYLRAELQTERDVCVSAAFLASPNETKVIYIVPYYVRAPCRRGKRHCLLGESRAKKVLGGCTSAKCLGKRVCTYCVCLFNGTGKLKKQL